MAILNIFPLTVYVETKIIQLIPTKSSTKCLLVLCKSNIRDLSIFQLIFDIETFFLRSDGLSVCFVSVVVDKICSLVLSNEWIFLLWSPLALTLTVLTKWRYSLTDKK